MAGKDHAGAVMRLHAASEATLRTLDAVQRDLAARGGGYGAGRVSEREVALTAANLRAALAAAPLDANHFTSFLAARDAAVAHAAPVTEMAETRGAWERHAEETRAAGGGVRSTRPGSCPTRALGADACLCAFHFPCSGCGAHVARLGAELATAHGPGRYPDLCEACRAKLGLPSADA